MRPPTKLLILSACLMARAAFAAIVVPGANGTDGALNITDDTVIDLSQAATGTWDQDNTANASKRSDTDGNKPTVSPGAPR